MRDLRTIFLIEESEDANMDLDIAYESLMDGNVANSYMHILSLLKEELSQIKNEKLPMSFLRFCGISSEESFKEIKKI